MGTERRRFDLVVFDWDGTLMDSAAQIVAAMQLTIRELGLPPRSPRQLRDIIGLGLLEGLQSLFPDLSADDLRSSAQAYSKHFRAAPLPVSPLFERVREMLAELHEAGYVLAVATGKSRRGLERALAETTLGALFAASRCADQCASKPDPQMIEEILWETGVDPARALMVGDTEYDMLMARSASVAAVGVTCGVHEGSRLLGAGAVAVLDSVADLPGWLAANGG